MSLPIHTAFPSAQSDSCKTFRSFQDVFATREVRPSATWNASYTRRLAFPPAFCFLCDRPGTIMQYRYLACNTRHSHHYKTRSNFHRSKCNFPSSLPHHSSSTPSSPPQPPQALTTMDLPMVHGRISHLSPSSPAKNKPPFSSLHPPSPS
jgi:hypothetical protein